MEHTKNGTAGHEHEHAHACDSCGSCCGWSGRRRMAWWILGIVFVFVLLAGAFKLGVLVGMVSGGFFGGPMGGYGGPRSMMWFNADPGEYYGPGSMMRGWVQSQGSTTTLPR